MTVSDVHRDERTLQVENASYRWAFHVFAYGLLLIVIYRSYVAKEAAWDLLALVIVGGTVASAYQWTHDILTRRSAATAVVGAVLAALLAMVLVAIRQVARFHGAGFGPWRWPGRANSTSGPLS